MTRTNVFTSVLHHLRPMYVRQETQAKAIVTRGVSEAINGEKWEASMERFPNAIVKLVVEDCAPALRLRVAHWVHLYNTLHFICFRSSVYIQNSEKLELKS